MLPMQYSPQLHRRGPIPAAGSSSNLARGRFLIQIYSRLWNSTKGVVRPSGGRSNAAQGSFYGSWESSQAEREASYVFGVVVWVCGTKRRARCSASERTMTDYDFVRLLWENRRVYACVRDARELEHTGSSEL